MYYAKPVKGYKGSYEYHVKRCIDIFYFEIERNRESLDKIMKSINYDIEDFKSDMYIAVSMHDFGKLSYLFQEQMKSIINNQKPRHYFRHELLSTAYVILASIESLEKRKIPFPYIYYAILSHHKQINSLYSYFEREFNEEVWPKLTKEEYIFGTDLAKAHCYKDIELSAYKNIPIYSRSIKRVLENNMCSTNLKFLTEEKKFSKGNIRTLYSISKGLLQYCDWIGSSDNKVLEQNISQDQLMKKIKAKVEADGKIYEERDFHKKCATSKNDIIAIAPTGSGKTEASLLWATNRHKDNIIFLMPTMVTSNSIFKRISNSYFEKVSCGLSHSSSDVYFALSNDYDSDDNEKARFELLRNKVFIPPVMVATVDQVLTCGFNIGYWSLKEYSLIGSSVIFDEIQAYDTFTIALITETIKKIKLLNGRVMIMSATMPDFLENHFKDTLNINSPIVAKELMGRKRNNWKFSIMKMTIG